jgi:hypothetical protein
MLMMILAVAVVFGAFAVHKVTDRFQKPAKKPVVFNQPQDAVARVIAYMFTDISKLNEDMKRLFWQALAKEPDKKRLEYVGFLWAYNALLKKYQRAFLADARASLKSGRARRSAARAAVEVKLIELYRNFDPREANLIAKVIEYNGQIMMDIAAKKPVRLPNRRRVTFTAAFIDELEKFLPRANQRRDTVLKDFLTPPAP